MSGRLLHSVPLILSKALIARGVGVQPLERGNSNSNWPIYANDEPARPDNVITVMGTQGTTVGRLMVNGEVQVKHGVSVRVRAAAVALGATKANEVFVCLSEIIYQDHVTIDTTTYLIHAVTNLLEPFHFGKDKPTDKLDIWTINALVTVRKTSP